MNKTVLLIEDNRQIMDANVRIFKLSGYTVREAETLAQARESLAQTLPDAIVLDIKLPDGNGLDFIPEIRRFTSAPLLLLTSMSERDERINGLRAGGDDYITKPYDIDELVARVDAFLRREAMQKEKSNIISHGALTLDVVAHQAFLNGEDLGLSPKEFALLRYFLMNEGKTLGTEELYKKVWNQPINDDTRALRMRISALRSKLADSGFEIEGVYGKGYCFHEL